MKKPLKHLKDRWCSKDKRRSFALNNLDRKLAEHLSGRNKFFIEAGGNDGIKQSNTLYFERYLGWKGLLVEAVPTLADRCVVNRPKCIVEHCALVSNEFKESSVEIHYRDLMSLIKGGMLKPEQEAIHLQEAEGCMQKNDVPSVYHVEAKTLTSVLDKHKVRRVDFMSLDVEGYELEVLKGLDLDKYCPEFLLVEVREEKPIQEYLSPWFKKRDVLHAYPEAHRDILYERISR